jgi:membrane associated rhomboid family serine protease
VISEHFTYRLKGLFLPVALLSAGLLAGYSLANWLFLAGTGAAPLDNDVIDYWIPLLLAGFLEFAFVAPRLQVLALNRHTLRFLTNSLAFALIAGPVCLAQGEIRATSGTITHLSDASQIAAAPVTRYYATRTICIDRDQLGFKLFAEPNDSQSKFHVQAFIVLPVCTPGKSADHPNTWIGLSYRGSFDKSSDPEVRKQAMNALIAEFDHRIAAEDPYRYRYLERSSHSSERRNFDLALESRKIGSPEQQIVLTPHLEPFGQRTGDGLGPILFALGFGALGWLTLVVLAPLDRRRVEAASKGGPDQPSPAMAILIPTASSYGLQALIYLNVIVFLAMMISGLGLLQVRTEDLIDWGGNYGPRLDGLGLLRLVTSQFVHNGVMHLVNNMYGLVIVGLFLAPAIGNWQMIGCYLLCGLGGSVAGALAHPRIVSVGASGAILGLMGIALTLALLRDSRIASVRPALVTNLAIFSAFTLVMGSLATGIDNAAHLGGFAAGAVVGTAIHLFDRGAPVAESEQAG